jgi:anthranilate/para-aminobenzoate synthase component I
LTLNYLDDKARNSINDRPYMAWFSLSSKRSLGSSARRFRFSKRNPARNVSTSLIGGTTKGDSNSFDGEESDFTGEERRSDGALFSDAPNWIHFEL